jgi:hypothetical protein
MSFQGYLDNIEKKTGKSGADFQKMAAEKGLTKFKDIIAWLKEDYDLGLGHARAIARLILHPDQTKGLNLEGKKSD